MASDWLSALIGVGGVVVGAGLSAGTNALTYMRQREDARASEARSRMAALEDARHERAMTATARALEAFSRLVLLGPYPGRGEMTVDSIEARLDNPEKYVKSADAEDKARVVWHATRKDLEEIVLAAILDVDDTETRARLQEVWTVIARCRAAEWISRKAEHPTRNTAAQAGLFVLGAFRRGEKLPPRRLEFLEIMDRMGLSH